MGAELVEQHLRVIDFLSERTQAGSAIARKLLELPPEEWESWSSDHPEARSYGTLSALCAYAEERLRTRESSALPITGFITRHVDAVAVPSDMNMAQVHLRFDAWQAHGRALSSSGRLDEARQAHETAATIARDGKIPGIIGSLTEDDIRRAEELIEKYGLHHLREEG